MLKMLVAASMLSFAAVSPALAETVKIPYSKADLADPGQAAALYQKVSDAAKTVCSKEVRSFSNRAAAIKECTTEVLDHSVRKSGEPALHTLHKSLRTAPKAGPVSATLAMR